MFAFTTDSFSNTSFPLPVTTQDSTANQLTERDLAELKKHVQIADSLEERIHNIFFGKHQYLEHDDSMGIRWEVTMRASIQRLRELLGDESFDQLANQGLVKKWFGLDQ